jgi:hypothetical protein
MYACFIRTFHLVSLAHVICRGRVEFVSAFVAQRQCIHRSPGRQRRAPAVRVIKNPAMPGHIPVFIQK